MRSFDALGKQKVIIGMVHLLPGPGTSGYEEGNFEKSLDKAVRDAMALERGGADGCLIQTLDQVFPTDDQADYARVAMMAAITQAVSQVTSPAFQIGVQILLNAISASLAVARVCGGSFLRCTGLIGEGDTQWGVVKADPESFFAYREKLGAQNVKLIVEVEGMHFHWRGEPRPIGEIAKTAAAMGVDAVEIAHPDETTNLSLIREIKQAVPGLPVILGGYTRHENAARRLAEADGAFVGTCIEDQWGGSILEHKVREYIDIVRALPHPVAT
jgi:membrane complex biogenesis BtpA family protein